MDNQVVVYDTLTQINSNTFINSGYTLVGWNTASNGSGTMYGVTDSISVTKYTELYAIWE